MTRRFCPKCGAALEFSIQKYCTRCGAQIPDTILGADHVPAAGGSTTVLGLPVWVLAIASLLVVGVGAVFLFPYLSHAVGYSSVGTAGGVDNPSSQQSMAAGTSLPDVTSIPSTGIPVAITTTVAPTPMITATTLPPLTTLTVVQSPAITRTPAPSPTSTVVTIEYEVEPTTLITLATTQVPPQPPLSSFTGSTPGAPYIDPSVLEVRVHELINEKRQQNGLSALSSDPFLADIARGHSWDMVTRNFFEHVNPDGKSPRDRGDAAGYPCIRYIKPYVYEGIAENLFQGNRASAYYTNASGAVTGYEWRSLEDIAQVTVNGWMDSPGHRKNILTEHFSIEGIGVSFAPDDKVYITENFC